MNAPATPSAKRDVVRRVLQPLLVFSLVIPVMAQDQATPPVPHLVVGFERFADVANDSLTVADGELLLTELSCTSCHRSSEARLPPKGGPRLDGVGSRLHADWLQRFLRDPQAVKPGTTMPKMLHGVAAADQDQAVRELSAFLLSLTDQKQFDYTSTASQPIPVEFWLKGNSERGARLFHQVGCIACHEPDAEYETESDYQTDRQKMIAELKLSPEDAEELGLTEQARPIPSVPLGRPQDKYTRQALTFFLLDPLKHRPAGRMPDMKLSAEEAADIVAWMFRDARRTDAAATADRDRPEGELITRGRQRFESLRCGACHAVAGGDADAGSTSLVELRADAPQGCLGRPTGRTPRYDLTDAQRQALTAALAPQPTGSAATSDGNAQIDQTFRRLNCYGCHQRAGQGGVGPQRWKYFETAGRIDIGDEGRMPPLLDHVGWKLQPKWMARVLDGTGDVRPHMLARMPRFAKASVESLPNQLAEADQQTGQSGADRLKQRDTPVDAGRTMIGAGCIQCHALREERLPGVLGIDLAMAPQRLRPEWFRQFLLDPASLRPRTRMPTFFPNGRSSFRELLDGDPEQQIASMWTYLADIGKQPLPEKLEQSKVHNFQLTPADRPIVLRTFMKEVGTHAIAVGYPAGLHIAFDAERAELRQAWRGPFLNAHGTWYDRFTPLAAPETDDILRLPAGPLLARLPAADSLWPTSTATTEAASSSESVRFRGYRLDQTGAPGFLSELAGAEVTEFARPDATGRALKRTILIRTKPNDAQSPRGLVCRLMTAEQLQQLSPTAVRSQAGVTVRLSRDDLQTRLRRIGNRHEWLLELPADGRVEFELSYEWK